MVEFMFYCITSKRELSFEKKIKCVAHKIYRHFERSAT